ncbi:formate dehydrogenase subunit gamma [Pelagibius sp. Alg239-R121]|uniref:formate dehydrogenase subunit gamma n=1 Tax=Pelagibius sp. Alg239-R121 TaxID=2993448 RepID=UPI0024A70688|nr:formate dehydrogenase subunit gamma [Pelagibius sp. Alg239-R121]
MRGLVPAVLVLAAIYGAVSIAGGLWLTDRAAVAQSTTGEAGAGSGEDPSSGKVKGFVPGNTLGNNSDTELWRAIRRGAQGNVSAPGGQGGQLIQSEGDNWRALRNGPVSKYGVWGMLGIIALLAIFFAIRGRIKIDAGRSNQTIQRFNAVERFSHWLMAGSFVILGLTGLNLLYGRYFLPDVVGKSVFAALTSWGKYAHNYLAFAFMAGLVLSFVLWVVHNIPNGTDLRWLLKGGGLFSKGSHPPAEKFNAGQKILFWLVMLGGLSISLSGLALLFPFEIPMFAKTFAVLNVVGFDLPTELSMMQETQLAQLWHSVIALVLMIVIVGHIYIGSVGMEGAFDAMGNGQVDLNWAREHHGLWVEKTLGRAPSDGNH